MSDTLPVRPRLTAIEDLFLKAGIKPRHQVLAQGPTLSYTVPGIHGRSISVTATYGGRYVVEMGDDWADAYQYEVGTVQAATNFLTGWLHGIGAPVQI